MHDIHAHLFHPKWYPRMFREAITRDIQRRNSGFSKGPVEKTITRLLSDDDGCRTLKVMDEAGIEKRVILILDFGIELEEAECPIDDIHRDILGICKSHQDRLCGFAGFDPRRKEAVDMFIWAVEKLGARGLKLHPTGGWRLNDDHTLALVSAASDRGLPILVHLGKTVDILSDINAQVSDFIKLASRFPRSVFIAGHSGFDLWIEFVNFKSILPTNIVFDVSGWQERRTGDGSNIVSDLKVLSEAFPKRVGFGTDSPFYGFNLSFAERKWVEETNLANSRPWLRLEDLYSSNNG